MGEKSLCRIFLKRWKSFTCKEKNSRKTLSSPKKTSWAYKDEKNK